MRPLATQVRCWQVNSKTGGWVTMHACVVSSVCVHNMLHVTRSCVCLCVHLWVGRRSRRCDHWPQLS